jgi:uncharacterized protein (TIGR03435 family)
LRGRAVVIEFWATWCPGCRDQIEHLNQLAERFASGPVVFLSVTDEDVGLVTRFLKDWPIMGWVGIDDRGETFRRYGIVGRPQTVLVDAAGVVRAVTSPAAVTASILEALIAGEPLGLPVRSESPQGETLQALPSPLFELLVRPAGPTSVTGYSPGALASKPGRFEAYGLTTRRLLAMAYGFPEDRVVAPPWCDESTYDLVLASPSLKQDDSAERLRLARQVLGGAFQLSAIREVRPKEVYVLGAIPGRRHKLVRSAFDSRVLGGKRGHMKVSGGTTQDLVRLLERELDRPILDETGLDGRYDFELRWEPQNPSSLMDSARSVFGLDLVPAVREMEHLVVKSIERLSTW